MKKLLISLAAVAAFGTAFASTPVTFPITCANSVSITATSTLADVQKCNISKQTKSSGMFEVEFKDNNNTGYKCFFATKKQTEVVNHCTK